LSDGLTRALVVLLPAVLIGAGATTALCRQSVSECGESVEFQVSTKVILLIRKGLATGGTNSPSSERLDCVQLLVSEDFGAVGVEAGAKASGGSSRLRPTAKSR
jgi:hypothetical protein